MYEYRSQFAVHIEKMLSFKERLGYSKNTHWYCQDLCAKKFAGSGGKRSAGDRGIFRNRL